MYEQIAANKRKTIFLIVLFVLLLSAVGLAVNYLLQGGLVGFVIVAIICMSVVFPAPFAPRSPITPPLDDSVRSRTP